MASLDTMPCEILAHILSALPGPSLAAAGATCRALYGAVAGYDDLWRAAYRRDFGHDAPPAAHADFATHGKDVRWLYALEAVSTGRVWRDPTTRRLCARLVSADGKVAKSGEFCLVSDPATGEARLCLDGYGAHTSADGIAREGLWREGVFVGPGRISKPARPKPNERYAVVTRCQAFDASLRAQGQGSRTVDDELYEGSFLNGLYDGFGVYRWPDGNVLWAEWAGGLVCGRTFYSLGAQGHRPALAGHEEETKRPDGSVTTAKRGVKRTADGDIEEALWKDGTCVWKIARSSSLRRGKTAAIRNASVAVFSDGSVRRSHGALYHVRGPLGDVAVADKGGPFFVAVSDACDDPRLAGRRFFPAVDGAHTWTTFVAPDNATASCLVPSDPALPLGRSFALYVARPDCPLDCKDNALAAIRAQMDSNGGLICPVAEVATDEAARDCAGLPFGRPVPADRGRTDRGPMIRCFLTGVLATATGCRVLSSGRAYETQALDAWRAHATCRSVDPETGQDLVLPDVILPWRAWMAEAKGTADLAWAIEQAGRNSGYGSDAVEDLTRFNVALSARGFDGARETTRDKLRVLMSMPMDVARDADGPLMRGFDGVATTCIEWRHPDWDPRGPWRLGTPDCALPEDETIGDHERPDAAPLDHLESHGIARVALESPSFLGAHLEGAFSLATPCVERPLLAPTSSGASLSAAASSGASLPAPCSCVATLTNVLAATTRWSTRTRPWP